VRLKLGLVGSSAYFTTCYDLSSSRLDSLR